MNEYLIYTMWILAILVVLRTAILFILSYIHDFKQIQYEAKMRSRFDILPYHPLVSVIVPAYNEEAGIYKTLESIYSNHYPNFEVIVVSDGSKDHTADEVKRYEEEKKPKGLIFVEQPNGGKGSALNNGIKNYAKGKLIMTLDADSILDENAIANSVKHFVRDEVVASAANIKVVDNNKLISFMQIIEYLLAHRYKRAFMLANMDFVIGGPGAMFRKEILEEVGYYETGTITEDLDVTLKIVGLGNKDHRIVFASDAIVYTEAPFFLSSLHKQRFRWKKGKYQCLKKHKYLYFNSDKKYSRSLTWFFIPYSTLMELSLFIEPLFVAISLYHIFRTGDISGVVSITFFLAFFMFATLAVEDRISNGLKFKLIILSPLIYFMVYTITFIEYVGLLKVWYNIKSILFNEKEASGSWEHVERLGKLKAN